MAKAAAQLHELLAVESDLKTAAEKMSEDALNTFSKKPEHFRGQERVVTFFDDARTGENTNEVKEIVTTVDEKLDYANQFVGKFWDMILQKEASNQAAVADLVVDDVVIASGLPSQFLLGMEHRLKGLRDIYIAIPTLEPAIKWSEDPAAGPDRFTAKSATQFKTEKQFSFKIMTEPTEFHAAQIKELSEDKTVARIETTLNSGMWTPARKAATIERIDKLLRAFKKARQRANTTAASTRTIAKELFAYIHG